MCASGLFLGPLEADAPVVIDPDGILALAVSLQGFQPVGVKGGEISQGRGGVQNAQSLFRLPSRRLPLANSFACGKLLDLLVAVTPDHLAI